MRMKVLASSVPVLLAGFIAGNDLLPSASPCISAGNVTLQMATSDWQNPLHVSFTADPARASVRVQIVDSPEMADFTVIDDIATSDAESCNFNGEMKFVSIAERHASGEPVIYLSHDGGADYRIFVQSRSFSMKEAAAMIVGARGSPPQMQAAAL